ncbi:hypothetical protein C8R43DRAFT_1189922 [Mycena crocata]|nr:hypothetical protein C8R43DRAFT_1189922 [Mycena crocata]
MPLFGSSHTHDNNVTKPHHATELEGTGYGAGGTGTHATHPTGTGLGGATHVGGPGHTGTAGMGEPGLGNLDDRHHGRSGNHAGVHNDGMMADHQHGTGVGGTGVGGGAIPPAGSIGHESGGGGKMTGKIEHAAGTMLGSESLKAKGLQKEKEAQGLKVQSREIAEAERLEHEAGVRRERAVAHGAHPDHQHVGGVGSGPNSGGPHAYT